MPSGKSAKRVVISFRWLLGILILIGVCAAIAVLRYSQQSHVVAEAYSKRADEFMADQNWAEAADALFQYLKFRPEDVAARVSLAQAYDETVLTPSQKQRSIRLHQDALSLTDDDDQKKVLFRRLAERQLEVGRFKQAVATLNDAEESEVLTSSDPVVRRVRAIAAYQDARLKDQLEDAETPLKEAVEQQPGDVELVTLASRVYRETGNIEYADSMMDQLVSVEENLKNPQAWLARYAYRVAYELPEADADLELAIASLGDDSKFAYAVGTAALQRARREDDATSPWFDHALRILRDAREANPKNVLIYASLGDAYQLEGKSDLAIEQWETGVKQSPERSLELRMRLASAYLSKGDVQRSQLHIDELRKLAGLVARRSGEFQLQRSLIVLENRIDLYGAQLHLVKQEPTEAIRRVSALLASIPAIPSDDDDRQLYFDSQVVLASAYGQQRLWRKAAAAYEKAANLELDNGEAAAAAAAAWRQAGEVGLAIKVLQEARIRGRGTNWLDIAALQLDEQASRPPDKRDWSEFDESLRNSKLSESQSWRANLLAAARLQLDSRSGADNFDAMLVELAEASRSFPDDPRLFAQLALIYQQMNQVDLADQAANRFRELETEKWRHLKLESQIGLMRKEYVKASQSVERAVQLAPPPERRELMGLAASTWRASGDFGQARSIYLELRKDPDAWLEATRQLAELDLSQGNYKELVKWVQEFRDFEGAEGVYWRYFEANRLLGNADASPAKIREADDLRQEIQDREPAWPAGFLLKGRIHAASDDYAGAAEAYERAIQLGDRRLVLYEQLLEALFASEQYEKSEEYLERLQSLAPDSPASLARAAAFAERNSQLPELLSRAEAVVRKRPEDSTARIWLAQLLILNGRDDDAEKELKLAVKLSNAEISAALVLFRFYATRNEELAARVLELIEKRSSSPLPTDRAQLLAQSWERLGNEKAAARFYRMAAKADPDNRAARLRLAQLLLTSDPAAAEGELRDLLKTADSAPARRLLAIALTRKGGADAWDEVQKLLAVEDSNAKIADLRLLALITAQRGGVANLVQSREYINRAIEQTGTVTTGDRLLLATSFEAEGELDDAQQQLEALVDDNNSNVASLSAICDFHLRNNHLDAASKYVQMMDEATVDGSIDERIAFLRAKVRFLVGSNQQEQVSQLVEDFAKNREDSLPSEAAKLQFYETIGQIYESAQLIELAEPWYRKLADADPSRVQPLATTLARLNRHGEALDLILTDDSSADVSRTPAQLAALVQVMSAGEASAKAWARTEPIWTRAEASDNWIIASMCSVARVSEHRESEAVAILERLRVENPQNVMILNNLASLIGESSERAEEALAFVDVAIDSVGEQPYLLDTKSSILVQLGRPDEAIDVLQHLVALPRPDPRVLFRLAVAQMRAGMKTEAKATFLRSRSLGLDFQVLTGKDRQLESELRELN